MNSIIFVIVLFCIPIGFFWKLLTTSPVQLTDMALTIVSILFSAVGFILLYLRKSKQE